MDHDKFKSEEMQEGRRERKRRRGREGGGRETERDEIWFRLMV